MRFVIAALALLAAACSPPQPSEPIPVEGPATGAAATNAPSEAIAAIGAHLPGFTPVTAQSDNSTGAQGYRVAGTAAGASYDVQLMLMNEGWTVVAISREMSWADVPPAVRTAAGATVPARVVERREPGADGLIYELYAAGAQDPVMDIRFADGQAAVMPPRH